VEVFIRATNSLVNNREGNNARLGTVYYLHPRGVGKMEAVSCKVHLVLWGGTCFFRVLRGGGCRKKP
jgi:hypothetical protein